MSKLIAIRDDTTLWNYKTWDIVKLIKKNDNWYRNKIVINRNGKELEWDMRHFHKYWLKERLFNKLR